MKKKNVLKKISRMIAVNAVLVTAGQKRKSEIAIQNAELLTSIDDLCHTALDDDKTQGSSAGANMNITTPQPAQIDCRMTGCKFYAGSGKCTHNAPQITLNENGKFFCWSGMNRDDT